VELVYCPACHHVGIKSRLERARCDSCGADARLVAVPYPWQYYVGVGLVLGGALFLFLPQVFDTLAWAGIVASIPVRITFLIAFLVVGLVLTNAGLRVMKETARERGREAYPEADA